VPPANSLSAATPLAQAWDASLQGHIADLNLRLVELLAAAAHDQETGLRTPVVSSLRGDWRRLGQAALGRLADCPYLLLDMGLAGEGSRPLSPAPLVGEPAPPLRRAATGTGRYLDLTQRALLTAWHFSHTSPLAARITLGISADACGAMASWRLPELERRAQSLSGRMCLRWESQLEIWRQLLGACADAQQRRLRQLQLRGLQLMAGDLLPAGH
jgi:hypothetical protein